jgi:hypothetical protein
MTINPSKCKAAIRQLTIGTKTLLTSIVTGTTVLQIQEARDFVIKNTVTHPHIASIAGGVFAVLIVLHNPKVQKFLHIEQETTSSSPNGTPVTTNTNITAKVD